LFNLFLFLSPLFFLLVLCSFCVLFFFFVFLFCFSFLFLFNRVREEALSKARGEDDIFLGLFLFLRRSFPLIHVSRERESGYWIRHLQP